MVLGVPVGLLLSAATPGCDSATALLDLAFLEPAAGLTQVETVGEVPVSDEGDGGSVDDVLRVACCFVADSEIARQIGVLDDARADGLSLIEALVRAQENCAEATEVNSFLRFCCLTCGAAIAEEVYGVVPE